MYSLCFNKTTKYLQAVRCRGLAIMLNCSTSGSSSFPERRAVQQPGNCIPHTSLWKNKLLVQQKHWQLKQPLWGKQRKGRKVRKSFNTPPPKNPKNPTSNVCS